MKTIIVYCSKTGNTEKVANAILRGLKGDADIIRLELTSGGLMRKFHNDFTFDMSPYDTVFLGGWAMMMRVHPFLAAFINSCNGLDGKRIVGFMTGGAIFSKGHVYQDFKQLLDLKKAKMSDFLYTSTLLGPALTEKKLIKAEDFARSILDDFETTHDSFTIEHLELAQENLQFLRERY